MINLSSLSETARRASRYRTTCRTPRQPLPAKLHGLEADDASNRLTREEPLKDVEANVPAGSTHGNEPATDVGPQRQPCAASKGFEFPPHIEVTPGVLQDPESVGSRHSCFGNVRPWRSDCG
jgi:hypothetical protein